jgi:mRNA-degrading endonuclease RelE of RelBE toxin-antitoxin system
MIPTYERHAPRLFIADTFARSLAKLDGPTRAAVKRAAFDLQIRGESRGLRLHKLQRAQDSGFWSVRVNRDVRIIVHRAGNDAMLCYAAHHDEAYSWAEHRRIVGRREGTAVEMIQVVESAPEAPCAAVPAPPRRDVDEEPPARSREENCASRRRLRLRQRAAGSLDGTSPRSAEAQAPAPLMQLLRAASSLVATQASKPCSELAAEPRSQGAPARRRDDSLLGTVARGLVPRCARRSGPRWLAPWRILALPALATILASLSAASLAQFHNPWSDRAGVAPWAGIAAGLAVSISCLVMLGMVRAAAARAAREVQRASDALRAGRLEVRAEPWRVDPEHRGLIANVNGLLEAFAASFEKTTAALESLSRGRLPAALPEGGAFDRQRAALDSLLRFLQLRSEDVRKLVDRASFTDALHAARGESARM